MLGTWMSKLYLGWVVSAVEGMPGTSVGDSVLVEARRTWTGAGDGSVANVFALSSCSRRVTRVALLPALETEVRHAGARE